jgi:predicted metal-binding protein
MAKIGLIRCEKNEDRCPLTSCLLSLRDGKQGFARYFKTELVGVFTCHCPGDCIAGQAQILKNKGADVIHMCTCAFAGKEDGQWVNDKGFCERVDELLWRVTEQTGLPSVKGTAHLPAGFTIRVFEHRDEVCHE